MSTRKRTQKEQEFIGEKVTINLKTPVEQTLVANMVRIVELATNMSWDEKFYSVASPYLQFVEEKMSLTQKQALLLSLFLELNHDSHIVTQDIARLLHCRNIHIISLMSESETLVERGLIEKKRSRNDSSYYYSMPADVVNAFMKNEVYKPEKLNGLTIQQLFDKMSDFFDKYGACDDLLQRLDSLVENNMQLDFCKAVVGLELYETYDRLLFYVFCNRFINEDDDMIGERDWEDFFESKSALRVIRTSLKDRTNALTAKELVESYNINGMVDTSHFKLTDKAKEMLFHEMNIIQQQTNGQKGLLKYTDITEKELFYNQQESVQIRQLSELLMPDKFVSVQNSLEKNGMRKGFACLFYGSPGTGKTETAYQLARCTQRDLMVIDVANIKSCYVGESEKNIKKTFDRYRNYVKQCERAPILLFNEADAILGIRPNGAQRAVDKMENSIQNIILQEMEQLDGIMIATTNLTNNLDNAFERRFIYKIEFSRPSIEAKCAIWRSMIPTISATQAKELASKYDFSGGQIENIARKRTVELILCGAEPDAEKLHAMCRAELMSGNCNNAKRRIGF